MHSMLLWSLCIASFIYTSVFYTEKTGGTDFPGGLGKVVPSLYITVCPFIKQHCDAGDVGMLLWSLYITSFIYTSAFYTENTGVTDFPGGLGKVVPPLYITVCPFIKQHCDAGDIGMLLWSLYITSFIYTSVFYTEDTGETDFFGGLGKLVPPLYITVWTVFYTENARETHFPGGLRKVVPPQYGVGRIHLPCVTLGILLHKPSGLRLLVWV